MSTTKKTTGGARSRRNTSVAKADIAKKCTIYPGYKESVEHVRSMLRYLGGRNAAGAFDMEHNGTLRDD